MDRSVDDAREIDERKRTAKNGKDEAQEAAEEKAALARAEAWSS